MTTSINSTAIIFSADNTFQNTVNSSYITNVFSCGTGLSLIAAKSNSGNVQFKVIFPKVTTTATVTTNSTNIIITGL